MQVLISVTFSSSCGSFSTFVGLVDSFLLCLHCCLLTVFQLLAFSSLDYQYYWHGFWAFLKGRLLRIAVFHILQEDTLYSVWPECFLSDTDMKTALGRVCCQWPLLLLLLPVQWEIVDWLSGQTEWGFACYSSLFLLLDAVASFLFSSFFNL